MIENGTNEAAQNHAHVHVHDQDLDPENDQKEKIEIPSIDQEKKQKVEKEIEIEIVIEIAIGIEIETVRGIEIGTEIAIVTGNVIKAEAREEDHGKSLFLNHHQKLERKEEEKLLNIGIFHHPALSILAHISTKPCKRQGRFQLHFLQLLEQLLYLLLAQQ